MGWNKYVHTNVPDRLTYHFLLPWHYCLDVYNARWVQTCGSTSLVNNFSIHQIDTLYCDEPVKPESGQYPTTQTNVLLDSPKNQPEIFSWMYYRQALLGNYCGWKNLGTEVGGWCSDSMKLNCKNSCEVVGFVQTEINDEFLLFWWDTLCCAEPVKP